VSGKKVLSPRVMVGEFSDWRSGMEAYGKRNAELHPPLAWAGPRPLGWNSWAAYADKINGQRYSGSAQFVHDKLEPEGFSRKVVYINFDAFWSSLDGVALEDAMATVKSMKIDRRHRFRTRYLLDAVCCLGRQSRRIRRRHEWEVSVSRRSPQRA
jgi:alpha-galactosidase